MMWKLRISLPFLAFCLTTAAQANEKSESKNYSPPKELLKGCLAHSLSPACPTFGNAGIHSYSGEEPAHSSDCLYISGFSDRDFNANGIYCKLGTNATYHLTAIPNALRYELRRINDQRWDLLRGIKTRRGAWVGIAIYAGFHRSGGDGHPPRGSVEDVGRPTLPQNLEWLGLSLKHNNGKVTKIDQTEP